MGNSADAKIIVGWRFNRNIPRDEEEKLAKLVGIVDDSGFWKNGDYAFIEGTPEYKAADIKREEYRDKKNAYIKTLGGVEFHPTGYLDGGDNACVFGKKLQYNDWCSPELLKLDEINEAAKTPLDKSLLEKALAVFKMKDEDDEEENEESDEEIVGEYGIWLCASYG